VTVPMWTPFALLIGLCCAYPIPRWVRRLDWELLAALSLLASVLVVWGLVAAAVWWFVW